MQRSPPLLCLCGLLVCFPPSVAQTKGGDDNDPLSFYSVSSYRKDLPTVGLLNATYKKKADALAHARRLSHNPDVVRVEVDGFDNNGSVAIVRQADGKLQLRFSGMKDLDEKARGNAKDSLRDLFRKSGIDGAVAPETLKLKEHFPSLAEKDAVGFPDQVIKRGSDQFSKLEKNENDSIEFKNKGADAADRLMTADLSRRANRLAELVSDEWPNLKLRVTAAWDDDPIHGGKDKPVEQRRSTHYEGRAVDITTSDQDSKKLSRLAGLAIEAGFDWVWYEDNAHVHASVKKGEN